MIGKDDEHRGEGEIQQITDEHIAKIDNVLTEKEKELMEV